MNRLKRRRKLAVYVGYHRLKEFLELCELNDVRWANGEIATDYMPPQYSYANEISFEYSGSGILYGSRDYYASEGYDIIDMSELKFERTTPFEQVDVSDFVLMIGGELVDCKRADE